MRCEKLYEKCLKKYLLTCFDGLLKTNNLHDGATSQRIQYNKKYFEDFFVLQLRSVCTDFIELSMTHLLKKNSRFYHLPTLRYVRNLKKCCKHFDTPCIILVDFEKFLITFSCLYFNY